MNCMLGQRGAAIRLSVPELTQFSALPLTILLFLYDYIFKSSRASSRQGLEKSRRLLCLLCYCKYSGWLYNLEHTALRNVGPRLLPHPWHCAQQCPTESTGKQQTKSVSLQKMFVSSLHDCLDRLKTNSSWGVRASGETVRECWGHLLGLLVNVIAHGFSKGL